ncbi:MAG: hypothetical protein L3K17_06545 [Thermoplasmata archaeon]|nr:hypothetical protein [Thermoplasmata archaeon]
MATGLAFVGRPYPTQIIPLGYPPLTFPLLGLAVVALGPIAGTDLFAALLMVGVALSTAALAATLLKSRIVALAVVAFLLADPSLLAMFFWGAYPNLLAFTFLNLALVGLLRAGKGHVSAGAALFWVFATLTVLTHSLVGAVLAGTVVLYLVMGYFVPLGSPAILVGRARLGQLEEPGIAARALVSSRGGQGGMVVFGGLVGGYYLGTFLAGVPHPDYLSSTSGNLGITTMGGALGALIPNLVLPVTIVVAVLVLGALGVGLLYAVVRDRRPQWLTAPAVLLLAWPLAVGLLILLGYAAKVVTDYHRFGYCFLLPAALGVGYVAERAWVLRAPRRTTGETSPDPYAPPGRRVPPSLRRPMAFATLAVVVGLLVIGAVTAPALGKEELAFTQVGHDAPFLAAVRAIQHSGVSGGILTVPGADKWVRALTGENAFAPYATTALLFYPSQQFDSQLAYFALSSQDAVSNGQVAASVRGTASGIDGGVPDYSVYQAGTLEELLRLPPGNIQVTLLGGPNGSSLVSNVSVSPTVSLPATPTGPMQISFAEPEYWLNISVTLPPASPALTAEIVATPVPPYTARQVTLLVTPPAGVADLAWLSATPGGFFWAPAAGSGQPLSYGNVTPASALRGATDFDPSTGTPAAWIDFTAPGTAGAASLGGVLNVSTPAVAHVAGGFPGVFSAPQIWQALGVRFILWWSGAASAPPTVVPSTEASYLSLEYQLPTLYQNSEWVVLEVAPGALAGFLGGARG